MKLSFDIPLIWILESKILVKIIFKLKWLNIYCLGDKKWEGKRKGSNFFVLLKLSPGELHRVDVLSWLFASWLLFVVFYFKIYKSNKNKWCKDHDARGRFRDVPTWYI